MLRINRHTVEFTTDDEVRAADDYDHALNQGHSIAVAARYALEEGINKHGAIFSPEFVAYLSEDTLIVTRGRVIATPKGVRFP